MKLLIAIAIVILSAHCCEHQHHHHHEGQMHHQQDSQHHHHHHHQHHHHHHQHHHHHHQHHPQEHHHHQHPHQHSSEQGQEQPLPKQSKSADENLLDFFTGCQKEVDEWVSIPKYKSLQSVLQSCGAFAHADYLLQFYGSLSALKSDFTKEHIDLMIRQFKKVRTVPEVLTCIVKERQFENQYLLEKKKYKYLAQFINRYPLQAKDALPTHANYTLIGRKTCYFFKALFEYYYLQVLSPSETLSTEFLRALTVRSDVFQHEDIAFCVSIDSVGLLSGELEDIDINNVYIKLPEIFHALRFLKLKEKCRDQHHRKLIGNLHTALDGMDMFKIMYKEYEPFVEIATEKMVQTQIRLLARKFAEIIAHRQKYLEYSSINMEPEM